MLRYCVYIFCRTNKLQSLTDSRDSWTSRKSKKSEECIDTNMYMYIADFLEGFLDSTEMSRSRLSVNSSAGLKRCKLSVRVRND